MKKETIKPSSLITDAQKKCAELSEKYKCKINFVVVGDDKRGEDGTIRADVNPAAAFFKPATTFTKMQCIDILMQSPAKAGTVYFESTILKDESDPRMLKTDNDEDVYHIGAVMYCLNLLQTAGGNLKKK